MQVLVVSNQPGKRSEHFIRAGESCGIQASFITYGELEKHISGYTDTVIKLEPPVYSESDYLAYSTLCREYMATLNRLNRQPLAAGTCFLNSPDAILRSLDKLETKRWLTGYPVTPLLATGLQKFEELILLALEKQKNSFFLKPRYGSGASGIMALRYHVPSGKWVAYTTLSFSGNHVFNTKRINRFTRRDEIILLAKNLFRTDVIVEEWIPKEQFKGENYDLRIVCLDGKVEYCVVRGSRGVITNLHLNNKAYHFNGLNLPEQLKEQIHYICTQATTTLGLTYAGVDVLLSRGSYKPYIIEINGQGDHIYQDIFAGNQIYIKQIQWIVKHIF